MSNPNDGVIAILSKLDQPTLFALASTVTQRLKRSKSTEDAIQNILKFSPSAISILRRKCITREILFSYLEDVNLTVQLPTTKNDLIDKITEFWKDSCPNSENNCIESTDASGRNGDKSNVNEMARQFSQWFYTMLNSGECGAEHFYPDANLKLNMINNGDSQADMVENDPEEIVALLLKTCTSHKLFFNLNDTEDGVQGRIDPHGLVVIMACGTLHVESVCVGIFEQIFYLARDPLSDNNWKIKNTDLNLRSRNQVADLPRLCDSELTSPILMLPYE